MCGHSMCYFPLNYYCLSLNRSCRIRLFSVPSSLLHLVLVVLVVLVIIMDHTCQASLVMVNRVNNHTLDMTTSDVFLRNRVSGIPANHSGLAILLPLYRDRCEFTSLQDNDTTTLNVARKASNYNDTGLMVVWSMAETAGCHSIADLVMAARASSVNLVKIGFPAVTTLFILARPVFNRKPSTGDYHAWGPNDHVNYGDLATTTTIGDANRPAISIVLINEFDSGRILQFLTNIDVFLFTTVYESGPWNIAYFSYFYAIYRWILGFILLGGFFQFICRLMLSLCRYRHVYLKTCAKASGTAIVVTPALVVALIADPSSSHNVFGIVTFTLTRIASIVLLWFASKCAMCGTSTTRIVAFRAFLAMGFVLQLSIGIINAIATSRILTAMGYWTTNRQLVQLIDYMTIAQSTSITILLLISLIWFLWRLKYTRYTNYGRQRSIQLTSLVAIAVLFSTFDFLVDADTVGLFSWSAILFQKCTEDEATNTAYATLFLDGLLFLMAVIRVCFVYIAFLPFLTAYIQRHSLHEVSHLLLQQDSQRLVSSSEIVSPSFPQPIRL
ncbi:hypothetical protein BDF22DRAFT_662655 [Syncephalis plumigaleata]|nr:hypothetical protein BDF22DRAFT_662655 [Syncephalis plumigaleata]